MTKELKPMQLISFDTNKSTDRSKHRTSSYSVRGCVAQCSFTRCAHWSYYSRWKI